MAEPATDMASKSNACKTSKKKIALIGGSGIKDSPMFEGLPWRMFDTFYGEGRGHETTDEIARIMAVNELYQQRKLSLVEKLQEQFGELLDPAKPGVIEYQMKDGVIFIPRHGNRERYGPYTTQYAANLIAAKMLGADMVVATSAVGSYKPDQYKLEDLVVPHDFDDQSGKDDNIWGSSLVVHVNPRPAFSEGLREILVDTAKKGKYFNRVHDHAVYLIIPGDRFGTSAEGARRAVKLSCAGADIVGMTLCPEASIALQLDIEYAVAAFPVDYDTDASHEHGTLEVMRRLSRPEKVPAFIKKVVAKALEYARERSEDFKLTQLDGNIIPGKLDRIKNPYLKQIGEQLINIYCR